MENTLTTVEWVVCTVSIAEAESLSLSKIHLHTRFQWVAIYMRSAAECDWHRAYHIQRQTLWSSTWWRVWDSLLARTQHSTLQCFFSSMDIVFSFSLRCLNIWVCCLVDCSVVCMFCPLWLWLVIQGLIPLCVERMITMTKTSQAHYTASKQMIHAVSPQ